MAGIDDGRGILMAVFSFFLFHLSLNLLIAKTYSLKLAVSRLVNLPAKISALKLLMSIDLFVLMTS